MKSRDGIHEIFEGDVQYPYADIGTPPLLHISSVTQDNRKSYTYICPGCHKQLRPCLSRVGAKRTKRNHFSHKSGERCDQDRYIHSTAERLLEEKWMSDEPFEVIFFGHSSCPACGECIFSDYNCRNQTKKIVVNLKEHYTKCVVEKKYDEFIPDLCLIDEKGSNEPIFIEIWSKHKNSEKKANSKFMIIEIRLKTMEELEALPKNPIVESDSFTFTNFERTLPGKTCDNYLTKQQVKARFKEKWDSDAPFNIIKHQLLRCVKFDKCIFRTKTHCCSDEEITYNLKEYYSQCLLDYSIGGRRYDLCLIDQSNSHNPIIIEFDDNHIQWPIQFRTIYIRVRSAAAFNHLLINPLRESDDIMFYGFKTDNTDKASESEIYGSPLVKYSISIGNRIEIKEVDCLDYRTVDQSEIVSIVCKQEDFSGPEEFASYCYGIIQGREMQGKCIPLTDKINAPTGFGWPLRDIARYCRYFEPDGFPTVEIKEEGGYPNYTHHNRKH